MTTTPDIEAIRKRVTGIADAEPDYADDLTALLSHIAALEAERTELIKFAVSLDYPAEATCEPGLASSILAAYLAQKEKK